MTTILDQIVAKTRETIAADKALAPASELESRLRDLPPTRDFHAALAATDRVRLIAEIKRASPSAGLIRQDFDPVQIATTYESAGAACISVLTDQPFFKGDLAYLCAVRRAVELPLLRKDFIVDEYQLLQARVAGADCALLIAECLSNARLIELHQAAQSLGLQTLIELYDLKNVEAVLATGTKLVGVNNRDLRTFQTDLNHTLRVAKQLPSDRLLVSESGIRTSSDVHWLGQHGVKAILVGESLMRQTDIGQAVRALLI